MGDELGLIMPEMGLKKLNLSLEAYKETSDTGQGAN
jgi:hypothetical protein